MKRKMSLRIYFENEQDKLPLTYKMKMLIREAIEATLDFEDFRNTCEVSVTFTDNEGIHELNKKFRGVDKPTDVLSFPLFDYEGESEEPPIDEIINNLGDIVISLEKAQEQAEEYGHSFERETAFLCVHSMLHLLGYDHVNGGIESVRMREKEETVLTKLGLKRNSSYYMEDENV
jgi:probable rRNA maturation factor